MDRLIKDGSKSVVRPMYRAWRSFCTLRDFLSNVGPPTFASSSRRELLTAVLDKLETPSLRLGVLGELGGWKHQHKFARK